MACILWEADHRLRVADGGGECDGGNIDTLCLRCHGSKSVKENRRARERKKQAAGGKTDSKKNTKEKTANRKTKGEASARESCQQQPKRVHRYIPSDSDDDSDFEDLCAPLKAISRGGSKSTSSEAGSQASSTSNGASSASQSVDGTQQRMAQAMVGEPIETERPTVKQERHMLDVDYRQWIKLRKQTWRQLRAQRGRTNTRSGAVPEPKQPRTSNGKAKPGERLRVERALRKLDNFRFD
eukprot:COSAG01_NODE_1099_length_11701_cov_8.251508_3_plen_240_part_00